MAQESSMVIGFWPHGLAKRERGLLTPL